MLKAGVQPARAVMQDQRYTTRQAADAIGVDWVHLANALKGNIRPCQAVRERLPKLLGVSVDDLFTPEMLAIPYMGDLNVGKAARRERPVAW